MAESPDSPESPEPPPPSGSAVPPPVRPAPPDTSGETIDQQKGRIFPCEGCGADLVFHIGQQRLRCPYCGFEKVILLDPQRTIEEQDFLAALEKVRQWRQERAEAPEGDESEIRCAACGATVLFHGALISRTCPYCGSPLQQNEVHRSRRALPFDGVIPFRIDRRRAHQSLSGWIRSRWLAPSAFYRLRIEAAFTGIYLPFWTFDALTFTRYAGMRGEHYWVTVGTGKNRRMVQRTNWYRVSGTFQRFFDDVLVPASRGLPAHYLDRLAPWPLHEAIPFTPEVLAGFYARAYDVELDEGFSLAKAAMDAAIEAEVRSRIGGDEQQVDAIESAYDAITFKLMLLPVWLLVYRFRSRPYQVLVNAATGEVFGERPYSWVKITLLVLLAALIAVAIGLWTAAS